MLLRLTPDYSAVKEKIDAKVGKTLSLAERKNYGRTSSANHEITGASIEIHNLLVINEFKPTCSLEMRPNGVVISFRSLLETYALVIPNHKLRIYKGSAEEYSFHKDHHFIKIWVGREDTELQQLIKNLQDNKADNADTRVEDLL